MTPIACRVHVAGVGTTKCRQTSDDSREGRPPCRMGREKNSIRAGGRSSEPNPYSTQLEVIVFTCDYTKAVTDRIEQLEAFLAEDKVQEAKRFYRSERAYIDDAANIPVLWVRYAKVMDTMRWS